jgi:hypothetical protein
MSQPTMRTTTVAKTVTPPSGSVVGVPLQARLGDLTQRGAGTFSGARWKKGHDVPRLAGISVWPGLDPGDAPCTHVFVPGSRCLDSHAVFGAEESLIREARGVDNPAWAAEVGLANPFRILMDDPVPLRADQAAPAAQSADVQPTVVRGAPS